VLQSKEQLLTVAASIYIAEPRLDVESYRGKARLAIRPRRLD
jgi:hypothetical protein